MKILLIGATGLLGRKFLATSPRNHITIPTYFRHFLKNGLKLDITNTEEIDLIVSKIQPQIIVHAGSIGNVDYCENHQTEAWNVNVVGTRNIIKAAKNSNIKVIFFSSNAVFDGKHPPYSEHATPKPLNFYGKTKVAAEKIIQRHYPQTLIFRLMTMYGWNDTKERKNPATWLIDRLQKSLPTPVVTDVFNNHLWVGQAAQSVWKAIAADMTGKTLHVAGKDCISRYQFAQILATTFGFDTNLLQPVTSDYFPQITPRAPDTCFETQAITRLLGIKPLSVKQGLLKMKQEAIKSL